MAGKMKLTYFDIRGLAEISRLLFAASSTEYEDCRFPISMTTPGDFSTVVRKEFDAAKEKGELDSGLGKVPVLEVDGVKIGQSKAIERFISAKVGMYGANAVEGAQIDALCEHVRDFKDAYNAAKKEADKDAALKKFFDETLPEKLGLVGKGLSGSGPWLVGGKISYADVVYYYFLKDKDGFFDDKEAAAKALESSPRIKASCEATLANAGISDWVNNKRPKGTLPF